METPVILLTGYIAGDTFHKLRNNHFADLDGKVFCGTKTRFPLECHTEIRLVSPDEFYTDDFLKFDVLDKLNLRRNHLSLKESITCGNCRKMVISKLKELAKEAPTR